MKASPIVPLLWLIAFLGFREAGWWPMAFIAAIATIVETAIHIETAIIQHKKQ